MAENKQLQINGVDIYPYSLSGNIAYTTKNAFNNIASGTATNVLAILDALDLTYRRLDVGISNLSKGKAAFLYQSALDITSTMNLPTTAAYWVPTMNNAGTPLWILQTNANTANTIVARDGSGNFSAGTITATLSGNASTSTQTKYTLNTTTKLYLTGVSEAPTATATAYTAYSDTGVYVGTTAGLFGAAYIGVNGDSTSYRLYVNGTSYLKGAILTGTAGTSSTAGVGSILIYNRGKGSATTTIQGSESTTSYTITAPAVSNTIVVAGAPSAANYILASNSTTPGDGKWIALSSIAAGSATNDSDGLPINTTYLKLSGGTLTGTLTVPSLLVNGTANFDSLITGSISGNAGTATALQTARTINGTSFNGTANITTANWGTARTITIKDADNTNTAASGTSINGSTNYTLNLPATIKATITGNASTASNLTDGTSLTRKGILYLSGASTTSATGPGVSKTTYMYLGVKTDANGNINETTWVSAKDISASGYWGNVAITSSAAYNKEPEIKSVTIGNGTTASGTKKCKLEYDATYECLKFTFN